MYGISRIPILDPIVSHRMLVTYNNLYLIEGKVKYPFSQIEKYMLVCIFHNMVDIAIYCSGYHHLLLLIYNSGTKIAI